MVTSSVTWAQDMGFLKCPTRQNFKCRSWIYVYVRTYNWTHIYFYSS